MQKLDINHLEVIFAQFWNVGNLRVNFKEILNMLHGNYRLLNMIFVDL